MHVSRPIRSFEGYSARPRGGLHPVLAYALVCLLVVAGTLLLSGHGITLSACGQDLAAACDVP